MKRTLLALALTAVAAAPLQAQTDGDKLIARVNGTEITNRDLDAVWDRIPVEVQAQYAKVGGKKGFLENYIEKQLIVQDAVNTGFAAKIGAPDELTPAEESALFNRYVREVLAATLITDEEIRKAYEERRGEFATPEQARLRVIRALKGDNPAAARDTISKAMMEIFAARSEIAKTTKEPSAAMAALGVKFSEVAKRVSDHESGPQGGELGWVPTHTLDPKIAQAARTMKPGTISGVLDATDSYQLVLVDEWRPAGVDSFDAVKGPIREFLLARNSKRVLQAVSKKTAELRAAGKVEMFVENLR